MKSKNITFFAFFLIIIFLLMSQFYAFAKDNINSNSNDNFNKIIGSHPRIFINQFNRTSLIKKAKGPLSHAFSRLLRKGKKFPSIPNRLSNLRNYIYKYGYLYQIEGDSKWADLVIEAMEKFPNSIKIYGGANTGYAYALEGLSIGFDWCYDRIEQTGKKEHFLALISLYYQENLKNLDPLPDFHNYAAHAETAIVLAGLATFGESPKAFQYLNLARGIMENGYKREGREGVVFNLSESVKFVGGACNWEGVTYGRRQLLNIIKYAEAWRTATNGEVNPWQDTFSLLENAGYYIIYSLRPDNLFENIGDVNYRALSSLDINNMAGLQAAFKNPHFTKFINKYYKWQNGKFKTDFRKPYLIFYFLWYKPDLPEASFENLPLSKRFGDIVIIRTGFGKDDTFVTFKSGMHWGFHSQLDHGSFTIFKHSPLAIDSGYYSSWKWGKKHIWKYWKRTVAHNSLLIHNPFEKKVTWPRKNTFNNDGGQRLAWVTFSPPHKSSGSHNKPWSISDLKNRTHEFIMGVITNYEESEDYVYVRTDLTNAYNNKYSGIGTNQSKRVSSVIREFVYLKMGPIIIYDKVKALSSNYTKKWLLHSGNFYNNDGKPDVNGTLKIIEGTENAGIAESVDSNLVTIINGEGKLFSRTILPEKNILRRLGGKGYEFWVNGKNYNVTIPKGRRNEDPGAWRIEIQPSKKSKYDEFLNVLLPSNKDENPSFHVKKIKTPSENIVGIQIEYQGKNVTILFNRIIGGDEVDFKYSIPAAEKGLNLVFNRKPGQHYKVDQKVQLDNYEIRVKENDEEKSILATSGGVLVFENEE